MNHFLDLWPIPAGELRSILDNAKSRKAARAGMPKGTPDKDAPLSGHTLAMIFEKNSTRTRVSFDMAIRQLGGTSLIISASDSQISRGESIEDTAQVLSRYVDAVMMRANRHGDVEAFAAAASVPVINGLVVLNRSIGSTGLKQGLRPPPTDRIGHMNPGDGDM